MKTYLRIQFEQLPRAMGNRPAKPVEDEDEREENELLQKSVSDEDNAISLFVALTTYWGYVTLMLFGHLRDCFGRRSGMSRYFKEEAAAKKKVRETCRHSRQGGLEGWGRVPACGWKDQIQGGASVIGRRVPSLMCDSDGPTTTTLPSLNHTYDRPTTHRHTHTPPRSVASLPPTHLTAEQRFHLRYPPVYPPPPA